MGEAHFSLTSQQTIIFLGSILNIHPSLCLEETLQFFMILFSHLRSCHLIFTRRSWFLMAAEEGGMKEGEREGKRMMKQKRNWMV